MKTKPREDATRSAEGGGWLRLHRRLKEHPRYAQAGFVQLWAHFLISAQFKPARAMFDGAVITLRPGQFISSRREIAVQTGLSEGMVCRLITDLMSDEQIGQLSGKRHSVYTVRNWQRYQGGESAEELNGEGAEGSRNSDEQRVSLAGNRRKKNLTKSDPAFDPPSDPLANGGNGHEQRAEGVEGAEVDPRSDPRFDPSLIHERSMTDPWVIHGTHKPQAGVHKNDPKKERRKEGNKARSRSGGERMQGGAAEGEQSGQGSGGVMVPEFEPVSRSLFRHEYEALLAQCERKMAALRMDPSNVVRGQELTTVAKEDVAAFDEAIALAAGNVARCQQLEAERAAYVALPSSYNASGFKPEVREALTAWRARVREIEAAMLGVKV